MALTTADLIDDICIRGSVTRADVTSLQRSLDEQTAIDATDIDALIRIEHTTQQQDASWQPLLIDATTDFLVNDMIPTGYVTAANARWLVERVAPRGRIETLGLFNVVVAVLEKARWAPESLAQLALEQVKTAIITGQGPLRRGQDATTAGQITVDDVATIRRILLAFGGDGRIAVTRREADVLFDIEDATANVSQPAEWQELFMKATASVVLATSGYTVPSRQAALQSERLTCGPDHLRPENFIAQLTSAYAQPTTEGRALARLERQRFEIITNEEASSADATWLTERILRNQKATCRELTLLSYLQREAMPLHPMLQNLVDTARRAA